MGGGELVKGIIEEQGTGKRGERQAHPASKRCPGSDTTSLFPVNILSIVRIQYYHHVITVQYYCYLIIVTCTVVLLHHKAQPLMQLL